MPKEHTLCSIMSDFALSRAHRGPKSNSSWIPKIPVDCTNSNSFIRIYTVLNILQPHYLIISTQQLERSDVSLLLFLAQDVR